MYLHCVPVLADAEEHTAFAKYMAEMSLIHFSFLSFPASMIATSICIYTLIQFEQIPFFPAPLASLSFFTYMKLLECITALRDAHIGMPSLSYSTVYRRYCRPELHSVATFIPRIHIPPTDAP